MTSTHGWGMVAFGVYFAVAALLVLWDGTRSAPRRTGDVVMLAMAWPVLFPMLCLASPFIVLGHLHKRLISRPTPPDSAVSPPPARTAPGEENERP